MLKVPRLISPGHYSFVPLQAGVRLREDSQGSDIVDQLKAILSTPYLSDISKLEKIQQLVEDADAEPVDANLQTYESLQLETDRVIARANALLESTSGSGGGAVEISEVLQNETAEQWSNRIKNGVSLEVAADMRAGSRESTEQWSRRIKSGLSTEDHQGETVEEWANRIKSL